MRQIGNTYGYIRKSPTGHDEIPAEFQELKLRKWAEANNSKYMGTFVETVEANVSPLERPIFSEMWKRLNAGDVIVMTEVYEISNSPLHVCILLDELTKIDVNAVFLKDQLDTSSVSNQTMINMSMIMKSYVKDAREEYLKEDPQK